MIDAYPRFPVQLIEATGVMAQLKDRVFHVESWRLKDRQSTCEVHAVIDRNLKALVWQKLKLELKLKLANKIISKYFLILMPHHY